MSSVADKLREMDETVASLGGFVKHLDSMQMIEFKEKSARAITTLRNALPELAQLAEAAQDLYELVEMNESVGNCLDSRVESLRVGQALFDLENKLELA